MLYSDDLSNMDIFFVKVVYQQQKDNRQQQQNPVRSIHPELLQGSIQKIRKIPERGESIFVKLNRIRKAQRCGEIPAVQLAKRLGVTQPRITKVEANEENLKLCTMKKLAEAMNCDFVYYFKPKTSFQDIVQNQAKKKAAEILLGVNLNMALENQDIQTKEAVDDMADDFIKGNTKRIWD